MRISRLYVNAELNEGHITRLDPDSSHYLNGVLRIQRGADLIVFNGDGGEYRAHVLETGRGGVAIRIGPRECRDVESPLVVHLGLGISRGERMDLALQKAVELGVNSITPLQTERCVVRLDEARRQSRRQHWQKLVISACEQCGRNRVPQVAGVMALEAWQPADGLKLFFDPQGATTLTALPRPSAGISILSGPEGGFAQWEKQWATTAGFLPVRLGPRILRAETAVLAALATMQVLWGDFGGVQTG